TPNQTVTVATHALLRLLHREFDLRTSPIGIPAPNSNLTAPPVWGQPTSRTGPGLAHSMPHLIEFSPWLHRTMLLLVVPPIHFWLVPESGTRPNSSYQCPHRPPSAA